MSLLTHFAHLRRLWALPSRADRIEAAVASLAQLPALLSRLHQEHEAYTTAQDELADLVLRRLTRLDHSATSIANVVQDLTGQVEHLKRLVEAYREPPPPQPAAQHPHPLALPEPADRGSASNDYLPELSPQLARFLNAAESHKGYRSQFQLWINEPVTFEYTEDGVTWSGTNERIVELPFALQTLASLPPSARILDVGSCESLLPLSLASLGYRVTAIDIRQYPFSHPRLHTVQGSILDWAGDGTPYDAVSVISSLEHLGLPAYGNNHLDAEADRRALARIRHLLRPGGHLVLTTPFGPPDRTEFQRTYCSSDLAALLAQFTILRCAVAYRVDSRTWNTTWDLDLRALKYLDSHSHQVVLIHAQRPVE